MTALAIQKTSLTKYGTAVKNFLLKVGKSIIIARQVQANRKLAELMVHEYPDHSVQSLWIKLNEETIEGYSK